MDFKTYKAGLLQPSNLFIGLVWGLVVVYGEALLEKTLLFLNLIGDYFFQAIFFLVTLPSLVPKWTGLTGNYLILATAVFAILLAQVLVWLWRLSRRVFNL